MDNLNLSSHFSNYFSISIADTPQLREEVFRIRYQVYCQELGYEPLDKFPDRMEKDAYDPRSIHCLLKYKPDDIYAGCVRLVLSDPKKPDANFPFENVCQDHLINFEETPRSILGEVSRLAVIAQFRKREGEQKTPGGLIIFDEKKKQMEEESKKRRFPIIALSLYLAATSLTVERDIQYAITLMEPRLARHLRMSGLTSRPVGSLIDFHGKRGPFAITVAEVVNNISKNPELSDLFQNIQDSIRGCLSSKRLSA